MGRYFKTTALNITRDGKEPIVALTVRTAESPLEQQRGLRNKVNIGDGMYFPFKNRKLVEFEMKGMRKPIDMMFIKSNIIQKILRNLKPNDKVPVEYADAVLEVPAGLSNQYSIREGDMIKQAKIYEFNSYKDFKSHASPKEYNHIVGEIAAMNRKYGRPENAFPKGLHRVSLDGKDNYTFLNNMVKDYPINKKHELTHAVRNRKGTKGYKLKYDSSPTKAALGSFVEELAAQRRMRKGTSTSIGTKVKDYKYPFSVALDMFKKKRKWLRAIR